MRPRITQRRWILHLAFLSILFLLQTAHAQIFKIVDDDDRLRVGDASVFPWSAIGMVKSEFNGRELGIGTGVMIGRRFVLTAGHNVHHPNFGWADNVVFIPGKNGRDEPFGRFTVIDTIVLNEWRIHNDPQYDIALIVLSQPAGQQTGFFQIAVESNSFFRNLALHSAGYPGDLNGDYQYYAPGQGQSVETNFILYTIDSMPGQSGSPVWYETSDNALRLVGLMRGAFLDETGTIEVQNVGIRINQQFANWIDDHLARHDDVPQNISAPVPNGTGTTTPFVPCGLFPLMTILSALTLSLALLTGGKKYCT